MSDSNDNAGAQESSSTATAEAPAVAAPGLKLNMLCGQHPLPGFINVDSDGTPDQKVDLEQTPWPWADNSVDEMRFHHTLQQLGATTAQFNKIIKEIYRVCRSNAVIEVNAPHPWHEDFIADPMNVRPIVPASFAMFSKTLNQQWKEQRVRNRPMGTYLDVDFEISSVNLTLEEPYFTQLNQRQISREQVLVAARQLSNVIRSIEMKLRVIKQ